MSGLTKQMQRDLEQAMGFAPHEVFWSEKVGDQARKVGMDRIRHIEKNSETLMTPSELKEWREQEDIIGDSTTAIEQVELYPEGMSKSDYIKFAHVQARFGKAMTREVEIYAQVAARMG